jgi:hypothetical protein
MVQALTHALLTPRLRLEPVTPEMAASRARGPGGVCDMSARKRRAEWCAASLGLVARSISHAWGPAPAPTRAVAIHREEGVVVGDVRFEPSLRAAREFEIGYGIARSQRRQGYAVEATGAVIDWLFDDAGVETIIAGCDRAISPRCAPCGAWVFGSIPPPARPSGG